MWDFPVIFLQRLGLATSKRLGFAKDHHEITRRRKGGGAGLRDLPKIWRFLFNICRMAEAIMFKFGTQLEFVKAQHKLTPVGKKWVWP